MSHRPRQRYGVTGRALTSPALLAASVAWQRPDPVAQTKRFMNPTWRATNLPPPDPLHSTKNNPPTSLTYKYNISTRRSSISGEDGRRSLVHKYLTDSKERISSWTRDSGHAISNLMKKYCSSTAKVSDTLERTEKNDACEVENGVTSSLLETRLSGSDVRIKWGVTTEETAVNHKPSIVATGPLAMPVAGTSSRSGRLARISQSNIRPYGSGTLGASYSTAGGQPLSGPEPHSPTKKELKHRFEITKKLGSGTYGKVSLAFDHKFEREVAVKLIKKSAIENKADLVRIRREIRIMSALNHPNIIQIFEVFENKDKIILVMEYASGGELYDYVSKFGSLPEAEARRLFRQITSSVLYCHKHKVAHRDLKLENILLDIDNNAKIADFGLSNYFGEKSLLSTFCGSPLYASPEIINGTPYRGPEVDCWSLGILLYTLVYGSMPFDGRDFNRMVRQIKRGAYYEPDTPSTASMLIRNMLRVNPDRRADIFDIASHWWLNLEENMPVIQELPENQITDHTPLTERAETMIVQDLADETDVFMEFGHLSNETRKKIEEFRRRRKQAEEYNDNSPVKPPKSRKTDGTPDQKEMTTEEKSLRGLKDSVKETECSDPLERLRQIENRLGRPTPPKAGGGLSNVPQAAPQGKEIPAPFKPPNVREEAQPKRKERVEERSVKAPEQPEDPSTARAEASGPSRAPSFVPVSDSPPPQRRASTTRAYPSAATYRIETDSLNMLMNQVLEQMDKGPVSLNMIARIKAHPLYDTRPMVKELLESIITAQPAEVQQQTSKLVQQQSQDVVRKAATPRKESVSKKPEEIAKHPMGQRKWHSVEVGFDPDEDENEASMINSSISTATDVTVQDTSFEDSDDQKEHTPVVIECRQTQTEEVESGSEEDEEYSDSEMEELADEVEEVENKVPVVAPVGEFLETLPPPDPASSPQYLDAFDRGLIKRQSKGKYQHSHVDMYGRGVSMECESPSLTRKMLGGPQPTPQQSPYLFDKAKKLLMQYPGRPDPSELDDDLLRKKKKKDLLKLNQLENEISETTVTITPSCVGSLPPRSPPPLQSEDESEESEEDEEELEDESEEISEEESEEESDVELENRRPRGPVIGAVRRDGDKVETTTSTLNGRRTSYMQSAPASIHASMSPEPKPSSNSNAKYFVTVAELKVKPSTNEPKPYSRIAIGGSNVSNTKSTLEKKIAERETQLKEELRETAPTPTATARPLSYANPLYRPTYNNNYTRTSTSPSPDGGKESWETTAGYIRRKNRERRFRNLTIAGPEEIIRAAERLSNGNTDSRTSPLPTDSYYSHLTGTSGVNASSIASYIRPRYHDDIYRRKESEEPIDTRGVNSAAIVREERGKSYDHSPDRPEYRTSAYAVGDSRNYYSSNASPSYTRKFEQELQPTSMQSWATEPRKFEVYKTRAERDREMNTMHTTPTAASSYRPSTYYSTGSDRPLTSSYGGYRREEPRHDAYRSDNYRSKYDDNAAYRRPYDVDRAVTPTEHTNPSVLPHASTETSYRPTARRVASALTDGDKRAYNRSRSMDRKQFGLPEHDYGAQVRNRLMSPESNRDYSYVNYHDSSNGRSSQGRDDKGPPRSILKNKQISDMEPRVDSGNGRGLDGGTGPVRSVIDRLRRHLSLEKSSSPQRQTQASVTGPVVGATGSGARAPSNGANSQETTGAHEESPKKKRSLLSFNRRRTSDVRLGADGKIVTNGYDDSHYKRPSSPIDKIKSLFRKGDSAQPASHNTTDYYVSSRYTPSNDKAYDRYPASNVAVSREPYVPQYRKYPAGSSGRDTATSLNRYSYTSGLTEQRRHWYDDHNMY